MKLAVTMEDVVNAKPGIIFFSANTIWWSHDQADLCQASEDHLEKMKAAFGEMAVASFQENPFPLDPFNSPLYQTENILAWSDEKRLLSHEAYGPNVDNRMETFMWSHAKNMNLIMDAVNEKVKEDYQVLTRFQNFHKFLVELGIFNSQEQGE